MSFLDSLKGYQRKKVEGVDELIHEFQNQYKIEEN